MKFLIYLLLISFIISACGLKTKLPKPKDATYRRTYPKE